MMGGTKEKAESAADTENALTALAAERDKAVADLALLTGERDQALADLVERTAERDKAAEQLVIVIGERDQALAQLDAIKSIIVAIGFAPEGGEDWDVADRANNIIGLFAGQNAGLAAIQDHIVALELQPEPAAPGMLLDTIDELIARVPVLTAELAAMTAKHGKTVKDLKTARAKLGPRPAKLRAVGPIERQPEGAALLSAIAAAEKVEIVFSDGKRELAALPPMQIEGDAWHLAANGVKLRIGSLPVHGLGHGEGAVTLRGYGLLLDGVAVAYAARIDPLLIQSGTRHELKDDVIF